jgi:hypothetical protein
VNVLGKDNKDAADPAGYAIDSLAIHDLSN